MNVLVYNQIYIQVSKEPAMYTRYSSMWNYSSKFVQKKKKINNKKQKETNKRKISRNIIKTLHSS